MMATMQILVCVGNCLFTIEVMDYIFCQNGIADLCNTKTKLTIFALLISAPTYFIKNLRFYSHLSLLSTVMVLLLVTTITYHSVESLVIKGEPKQRDVQWSKIPAAVSIYTYALEGIGLVMPVKNSMEDQSQFRNLLFFSIIFVSIFFTVPSVITSKALGVYLESIVVMNFSKGYPLVFLLQIIYAACIFLTYPINLFPVYTIFLNSTLSRAHLSKSSDEQDRSTRRKAVLTWSRVLCMVIIFAIVFTSPNFLNFLSLVGAIFVSAFGFFYPVLLYDQVFGSRQSMARMCLNYVFFTVMAIISAYAVWESVMGLFSQNQHAAAK